MQDNLIGSEEKPNIAISSCLLGEKVRHDGSHRKDRYLTDTLGGFVQWVPVCPEVEAGMGIPREPIQLTGNPKNPRLLGKLTGTDWTTPMKEFAKEKVRELKGLGLSGYILKQKSPSCGMERVLVSKTGGIVSHDGRGLYASVLMSEWPLLPVEDEGRLNDPGLRDNFIERVFAYQRWHELAWRPKGLRALGEFHRIHKFLMSAHSEVHLRRLGRLVATAKSKPIVSTYKKYGTMFMEGLSVLSTQRKHTNVLQHMLGYVSDHLSPKERGEMVEVISDFHRRMIPLIVPVTLIRHYVRKYDIEYLADQIYLQPHPKELMLRNHV